MKELKPCPFCGGEAKVGQNFLDQFFVRCLNEHCGVVVWGDGTTRTLGTKSGVIAAWNRRVSDGSVSSGIYDQEEIHRNCTVQIWRNSVTGEVSFGWWKEGE